MSDFLGLRDTTFELVLISGDPDQHTCDQPISVDVYRGQVIDGVLAHIYLMVGTVGQ